METKLYRGDLAVVKKVDLKDLKVNDIIVFREDEGYVVTHRIVEIVNDNGETKFIAKGDNNNKNDDSAVSFSQVEGKYSFKIKRLGNIV